MRMSVSKIPPRHSAVAGTVKSPALTKVAELPTMMPPFLRPISAMNKPMPQVTAILSECGMAAIIFSRTPETDKTKKIRPLINTMPRASDHAMPLPRQIVKVKNALMPIPGASAMG